MPENPVPDEDMTEIYDADVPRVDLVDKGANGVPGFLLMKQDADAPTGLLDANYVRDLITKAEPKQCDPRETVTMSGSPAAIAALIHGAPVRKAAPGEDEVAKAEASTQSMNDRPDSDFAYVESGGKKDESGKTVPRSLRHFPIYDAAHVRNALSRAPQSPFGDKAMPKIRSAAKKFDIDVAKAADDTPETSEVAKDMAIDDGIDDMDPTVVLAAPDEELPGDPADPGSPAWEAIDAATARKWTAIAARLRAALSAMSDREMLEAATADPSDAESAMDLDDAACAVDYIISVLAPFAVDEQAEADCGAADLEMVGKALAALDPAHLDTVESLGAIRKAGRTLSATNESALRAAIQALQQILASLPAAPVTKEAGQPVAKTANEESDMPTPTPSEDVTAASGQEPAMGTADAPPKPVAGAAVTDVTKGAAPVVKAEKTPQVAIYDAKGNLVGTVDPAEITMLAPAKAPEAKDDGATPNEPAAPATETPAAPPTDMTPAPAASVGIPADAVPADGDDVAKATENVLKGNVTELVKAALDEHSARQTAALAEQASIVKSLEDRNRALEERNETLTKQAANFAARLENLENQPAVMAIASNGAVPLPQHLRGQDRGTPVALAKAQEMSAAFRASDDAVQQQALAGGLNALAIEKLREIHAAGPR